MSQALTYVLKFSKVHCKGISTGCAALFGLEQFHDLLLLSQHPYQYEVVYINPKFTKDETKSRDSLNNGPLDAILGNSKACFGTQLCSTPELCTLNHYATLDSRKNSTELLTLTLVNGLFT